MFGHRCRWFPLSVTVKNLKILCKHYSSSALSGIKILDLTRILAGPFCTMILGDLGANIIKVEHPKQGDDTRSWGPPFVEGHSCYYLSINRNKKSICIDLKKEEGQHIVQELATQSDIVVENYLPGKLDKFGLGYNQLKQLNSRLIYCSLTGYGPDGPYASRPGYDVIAASTGGLLHATGTANGEPCRPGVALTDLSTGLYAHGAILAALYHREKTGLGQKIDVNLLSTQVACLVNLSSNYLNANVEPKRWGTAHESICPYQAFRTKNGYLTVGGANDRQFRELCLKIDRLDLAQEERYSTNAKRVENRVELIEEISKTMSTKTLEEWLDIFRDATFPFAPINSFSRVFEDPQVIHNNLVHEMEHPGIGRLKLVGPPVKYSESENKIRHPPPLLGQHTISILRDELGYSETRIQQLKEKGVIS
nr:EOG090X05UC [Cyclestheria hislopi]